MTYQVGLGGPSFVGVDVARQLRPCARLATHIEFENTWNHDDGVRTISVLEHCKTEGLGTIDEESAAEAALVPNNPVPRLFWPMSKSEVLELEEGLVGFMRFSLM